jgi:hypothetical protein
MSLADELLADLEEAAEEDEQEEFEEILRQKKAEKDIKKEEEDEPMLDIKGIMKCFIHWFYSCLYMIIILTLTQCLVLPCSKVLPKFNQMLPQILFRSFLFPSNCFKELSLFVLKFNTHHIIPKICISIY